MEQRRVARFTSISQVVFSIAMASKKGSLVDLSIRSRRIESPTDIQPRAALEIRIAAITHTPFQIQHAVIPLRRRLQFCLECKTITRKE
jgi:hypothetical protein